MPTVAPGKETISLNVPEGTRYKLEKLRKQISSDCPEFQENCEDNGVFVGFIVDRFLLVHELANEKTREINQKMAELERTAAEREAEIKKKALELEEKRAELTEVLNALKQEYMNLLIEFKKAGGTTEDLISLLRLVRSSGIRPTDLVSFFAIENVPNIVSQISRLEVRLRQRLEEIDKLEKAIASLLDAVAQLTKKKEETERAIEAKMRDLERADNAVTLACAVARDVGLYVNWIRDACTARNAMTVREVMLVPALVMAGAILEAAASAYGDKEITLMPGPRHPLPMQVTLREISRSLAPPEAYREQAKLESPSRMPLESVKNQREIS
ncbi:MAG: hypothetical protein K6U74_02200 [Firmicutes bacterium]|nr:hypothetical protein [Bacillota bacterium]